jgi:hypothetical protein
VARPPSTTFRLRRVAGPVGRSEVASSPEQVSGGESLRAARETDQDHRTGVETSLIVALFAAYAVYASVFALAASGDESVWGAWAAGAYAAAAGLAVWLWRRFPGAPLVAALVGSVIVPAATLPVDWKATSEVPVITRAATLWLAHGTPYLASSQLVSWRSYDPYLPGMSIFGLPHAVGLRGLWGDPLTWLAVATFGLLVVAFRIAAPRVARRCTPCRRRALWRVLLLVTCPVFALPMALGVTDPTVIALLCVGLAAAAHGVPVRARSAPRPADDAPACDCRPTIGPARRGHPVLGGIAIGAACALKATAWPALPVIAALLVVRDGRKTAGYFVASSLTSLVALIVVTAPALLTQPGALWQNLVAYPLGLTRRLTQAASPLPGHLLAGLGSLGHIAAIALLGAAALAMCASLVVRPPRTLEQTVLRLAIGLTAMFILAPDARFGYFAYPIGIVLWLVLTAVTPRRGQHTRRATD